MSITFGGASKEGTKTKTNISVDNVKIATAKVVFPLAVGPIIVSMWFFIIIFFKVYLYE